MLCCKARAGSRKANGGRREIWGRGLMLPEREKPTRLMRRAIIHVNGGGVSRQQAAAPLVTGR